MSNRWIVIEDIDLVSPEILGALMSVIERGECNAGTLGKISAKEGFRMFATRRVSSAKAKRRLALGEGLWNVISLQELPFDELDSIVQQRFDLKLEMSNMVLNTYRGMKDYFAKLGPSMTSASGGAREPSMRELIKWCDRISRAPRKLAASEFQERALMEAIDVFLASMTKADVRLMASLHLASFLAVPHFRVHFLHESYVPGLAVGESKIQVGRTNLNIQKRHITSPSRPFATTKLSLRLLEKVSVSVFLDEPVLLVGETGTGKTTIVQYLATLLGQKLLVVNMSNQSDSSDLLGGFKPVEIRALASPVKETFHALFERTFNVNANETFLKSINKCWAKSNFKKCCMGWKSGVCMAKKVMVKKGQPGEGEKRAKIFNDGLQDDWNKFEVELEQFEIQMEQIKSSMLFSFMEGGLVKAVQNGWWILLDEINLAGQETLETLSGLLQSDGSILLTERGDTEPIRKHKNFRLFGCMNPATDVGKRDLPSGFRSRFTEVYVDSPDSNKDDLLMIVRSYLASEIGGNDAIVGEIVDFYQNIKGASQTVLYDGADSRPHFSIRTLSRALTYAVEISSIYGLRRALFEGLYMTFITQLGRKSTEIAETMLYTCMLKGISNASSWTRQIPKCPGDNYKLFDSFWLAKGAEEILEVRRESYILTPSVQKNLRNLARGVLARKNPILIQGPTSSGKTSMIEYLAQMTGHRFVRINNHEHTDLQEYLGTYVSDDDGKLVFQEGILVQALRKGHWIVLDELNLAPTDVLEALNRLLDDNRELLIPETQEVVKPHDQFMLFATQNPPGLYGGRKVLSRAFRNRFLELHFEEIPEEELGHIIERRCQIAPSYAKKLVETYRELHMRRQKSRIFEGRHGFITLRDLFRWAERRAESYQKLAEDGYMILGERVRREDDKIVVKDSLEKVFKVKIDADNLYDITCLPEYPMLQSLMEEVDSKSLLGQMVWTKAMKRLFALVATCLRFNEPILLVGETGCGKTTICQVLALLQAKKLHLVNCHQNTETSDFLGSQRPLRHREEIGVSLKQEILGFLQEVSSPLSAETHIEDEGIDGIVQVFESAHQALSK